MADRPAPGYDATMEPTAIRAPNDAMTLAHSLAGEHAADRVRIVSTPGICGGRPRIDGHRIQVEDVAIWHERMGMSPDEIVSEYPSITLADVHAALAYYYENRERIDADIDAAKRYAEEMKAKSGPSRLQGSSGQSRSMPRTIRFHLDENCSKAIAGGIEAPRHRRDDHARRGTHGGNRRAAGCLSAWPRAGSCSLRTRTSSALTPRTSFTPVSLIALSTAPSK